MAKKSSKKMDLLSVNNKAPLNKSNMSSSSFFDIFNYKVNQSFNVNDSTIASDSLHNLNIQSKIKNLKVDKSDSDNELQEHEQESISGTTLLGGKHQSATRDRDRESISLKDSDNNLIKKLNKKYLEYKEKTISANTKNANLQKELQTMQTEKQEMKDRIQWLNNIMKDKSDKILIFEQDVLMYKNKIGEQENYISERNFQVKQLVDTNAAMQQDLVELRMRRDELSQDNDRYRFENRNLAEKILKLKGVTTLPSNTTDKNGNLIFRLELINGNSNQFEDKVTMRYNLQSNS
mmetsp:Transcript_54247/g.118263  ORF Transcript_54247/g.118263 Transcript_54247/m.118263 type:complete len:292 (+) Transcript_54247:243-1118(+)|eukprot:CAMPEP_0116916668 /NCGR_PEP_ID=MMETSP0467-20121206/18673_1 /TAXON_ID=283647 /ORGANISM="Mesodinium pulex, Strain SPMC105" /LENGTH=291 /DNA_ID=CAMNT_0004593591 /DNA_START=243 /DNA_END=1118 /DNA_ORIENTATION=+